MSSTSTIIWWKWGYISLPQPWLPGTCNTRWCWDQAWEEKFPRKQITSSFPAQPYLPIMSASKIHLKTSPVRPTSRETYNGYPSRINTSGRLSFPSRAPNPASCSKKKTRPLSDWNSNPFNPPPVPNICFMPAPRNWKSWKTKATNW